MQRADTAQHNAASLRRYQRGHPVHLPHRSRGRRRMRAAEVAQVGCTALGVRADPAQPHGRLRRRRELCRLISADSPVSLHLSSSMYTSCPSHPVAGLDLPAWPERPNKLRRLASSDLGLQARHGLRDACREATLVRLDARALARPAAVRRVNALAPTFASTASVVTASRRPFAWLCRRLAARGRAGARGAGRPTCAQALRGPRLACDAHWASE